MEAHSVGMMYALAKQVTMYANCNNCHSLISCFDFAYNILCIVELCQFFLHKALFLAKLCIYIAIPDLATSYACLLQKKNFASASYTSFQFISCLQNASIHWVVFLYSILQATNAHFALSA